MIDALLIYPKLGSMDSMVVDLPLSIIYASSDSVKQGHSINTVDLRCEKGDWKEVLKGCLEQGALLAGLSVMTGTPLRYAREISNFIKSNYPDTKIVWGGPHVTILPETIREPFIDFLIRGFGSRPLSELINILKSRNGFYSEVKGLSYKQNGKVIHNVRAPEHEMLCYKDIPYNLIDVNSSMYRRSYMGKRLFPIFTSIGCPYRCSFCVSPTVYKAISGPKWKSFQDESVLEHIEYVVEHFNATHICFMDDTSFPDLKRMRVIFEKILERGIKITLEFRGARVNEIDRMDDSFLDLMVKAGGRVMMVGVESASNRVLKSLQKGITKEQILRVSQKLACHRDLIPYYNFIYGTPGETYEDLIETKDVVLKLLSDNPKAYFGFGGDWKPIPGSKMLDVAETQYDFLVPKTLDDWIQIDSSDSKTKIVHPWYTRRHNNLIKLMQIASFVIDDKVIRESSSNKTIAFRMLRLLSRIYKPIALFRLRFNFHYLLIEYGLWRLMVRILPYLKMS